MKWQTKKGGLVLLGALGKLTIDVYSHTPGYISEKHKGYIREFCVEFFNLT